jgi:dienelactone hydrolase
MKFRLEALCRTCFVPGVLSAAGLFLPLRMGTAQTASPTTQTGPSGSLVAPRASQTVSTSVLPSKTDPQIDTFDSVHTVYRNPAANSRRQLLVFLPGTFGQTRGTRQFCTTAADLGYDVVSLMYPDDLSASFCGMDEDPEAFAKFRLGIIEGGEKSPRIKVSRANSIENRLIKLLLYLKTNRPGEAWGQYLEAKEEKKEPELRWESIAFAGQSQGGGHAALLACRHKVARVLMFSSPKDWSRRYARPAAWYTPSATPPSRCFAFVHEQDKQGCSYPQQLEILKAMHLTPPQSVDKSKPPFAKSHVLTTNFPGTPVTSRVAHNSEVSDAGTPKETDGTPKFKSVWIYMLTAE